jgi:hypothetical protein
MGGDTGGRGDQLENIDNLASHAAGPLIAFVFARGRKWRGSSAGAS